jgi:hypothetical protein
MLLSIFEFHENQHREDCTTGVIITPKQDLIHYCTDVGALKSFVLHHVYHFNNIFLRIKINCDRFPNRSISAIHVRCLAHIL